MSEYRLLIGGNLVEGDSTMDVVNPATGKTFTTCPSASLAQTDLAIAAAKASFPAWAALAIEERRQFLTTLADAVELDANALARLLTQEQGKPLAEAEIEVAYTIGFIRHLASHELAMTVVEDSEARRVEQHRRPLGVVAAITPWNFPLLMIAFKLPFALLAGNTLVLKPAPTTPLTALKLGEIIARIFPAGVVNIIVGTNEIGSHLTAHPDIAKISFTGSTPTGRKVMESAASTIKRLTLELGGNDAAIVLADVDPATVAQAIFGSAFMNAGQVCVAVKRVYAHSDIYEALCEELGKLANAAIVDDGFAQGVQIGPLQNRAQFEKVQGFLDDARANGTIIAGGEVLEREGYFIRPTIVRDISDGTRLVDEEQFGPILPVIRFTDPEDALARANNSVTGLGGSIWSANIDQAHELALRMEAGTVWINKHLDMAPNIPFGGAKQSGLGVEFSDQGLEEYTQTYIINAAK